MRAVLADLAFGPVERAGVQRQSPAERPCCRPHSMTPAYHPGTRQEPRTRLLSGFGVVAGTSRDQGCDEGAEQGFAASARVVHELEEAEVKRQLVLRDAAVRSQPGAQQRPEALCGRPWRSNACLSGRSTVLRRIGQPGDDGNFLAWSVSRYVTGYKGLAPCRITRGRQCWRDVPERLDHVGAGLAHRSSDCQSAWKIGSSATSVQIVFMLHRVGGP